jgi:hypothetical protein
MTCRLQVCYPKRTDRPLYHGLVTQCESLAIPFISMEDLQQCQQQQQQGAEGGGLSAVCDVVIDALFGFSFKGTPRPPFDTLLQVGCPSIPIRLSPCLTGCYSNTASDTSQTPLPRARMCVGCERLLVRASGSRGANGQQQPRGISGHKCCTFAKQPSVASRAISRLRRVVDFHAV